MTGISLGNGLGIGNGLSAGLGLARATGLYFSGYVDPDALTYFNAVAATGTALTDAQKAIINVFFMDMKAAGLYAKYDGGNFLCLTTAAQCYVDWKVPTRVATVYATPTFTFTANRQFMGSGSGDTTNLPDSINTGFTPSTAGGNFTQNSAHLAVFRIQSGGTTSTRNIAGANGTADFTIMPRSTGDVLSGRSCNATADTFLSGIVDGSGFFLISRTGAAASFGQNNATQGSTVTTASTGNPNDAIRYLQITGVAGALATEGLAFGCYGGGLTTAEGLLANTIITAAVTALRAL